MQFPLISTLAVSQYPMAMDMGSPVHAVRFLDGEEQRYLTRGRPLRRWLLRFSLLRDVEIAALETFYALANGQYTTFDFPDPISGTLVPHCRFAEPDLVTDYLETGIAAASLWVIETNGQS